MYGSTSQRDQVQVFEPLSSQTDWTQDTEELLLGCSSDPVSTLRFPALSSPSSFMQPTNSSTCDQPMVDTDEDLGLNGLLLRLTGHGVPSAQLPSIQRA